MYHYGFPVARHNMVINIMIEFNGIIEIIRPVTYVSVRPEGINIIIRTMIMNTIGDRRHISLLILGEFKRITVRTKQSGGL